MALVVQEGIVAGLSVCMCACVVVSLYVIFYLLHSSLIREYRGLCRRERELERELSTLTEGLKDRAMERCVQMIPCRGVQIGGFVVLATIRTYHVFHVLQ